ncbi:folate family ECF transporter S component, partial [Enterococcus faecium]
MLVMKRKVDAHMIAVMGLLIALMVVLSQILGFETAYLKLTFTFVPELIMGMLFGPFWTAVGASVADIAGMILFPKS